MNKSGLRYGEKLGRIVGSIRSNFYWLFPKLLLKKYKRYCDSFDTDPKPELITFFKEFITGFVFRFHLRMIICESCKAVGLDYQSEKHGWHYHGNHIWSCPDCKDTSSDS